MLEDTEHVGQTISWQLFLMSAGFIKQMEKGIWHKQHKILKETTEKE